MSEQTEPRLPVAVLIEIAETDRLLQAIREVGAPYEQRAAALRAELETAMRAVGAKTIEADGLQATVAIRRDTKIVDAHAVASALFEIGKLKDCQNLPTLNATAVKKLAKERGEPFPGMEETETAYLTVKAVPS